MGSLYGELRVFTGNANPALAERICAYIGIPLGKAEVFEFSNENIFVRILDPMHPTKLAAMTPRLICISRTGPSRLPRAPSASLPAMLAAPT